MTYQILPCRKLGQGQLRVIIWTTYDGLKFSVLQSKQQNHGLFDSGRRFLFTFFLFLRCMEMVASLVM